MIAQFRANVSLINIFYFTNPDVNKNEEDTLSILTLHGSYISILNQRYTEIKVLYAFFAWLGKANAICKRLFIHTKNNKGLRTSPEYP